GEDAALAGGTRRDELRQFCEYFFRRQSNSDDAGGGRKYFGSGHAKQLSGFAADSLTGLNAGAPGGAVGVSGVHDNGSNASAGRTQRRDRKSTRLNSSHRC